MPVETGTRAAAESRRLFYWCHTTSRQSFETGIQRVTRRLDRALGQTGIEVVPVGRDERSGLPEVIGRGTAAFDSLLAASGETTPMLFVPELTADLVAIGADPVCIGQAYGLRVCVLVHDLIPLKLSAHYSAEAVAMFTAYYESLARADAVLATTKAVVDDLRRFLEGRALRVPPIDFVPLPAQFGSYSRVTETTPPRRDGEPLRLLSVGSWERRKNLPALLRAFRQAQSASGSAMRLTLVGRRGFDPVFDAEIYVLLAEASDVTDAGALADGELAAQIEASDVTIYPSWEEGFGLPIGESLWLGRPCLCHDGSAMREVAPGGGTMMIDMTNEGAISEALVALATREPLRARLACEIQRRPLASWFDYGSAVAARLNELVLPVRAGAN